MNIREVEAYQTPDGKVFKDERKAIEHYNDLLGEELDGLLLWALSKNERLAGNITRVDQHAILMEWMKDKDKLKGVIDKLYTYLNY